MSRPVYDSFKNSFKIFYLICKISGILPISYNGEDSFLDYLSGVPMIIFIYYCIVVNRLNQSVYYSLFENEATIISDMILIYSVVAQFSALAIYNFLTRAKIKAVIDILDRVCDDEFYLVSKYSNFKIDLVIFFALLVIFTFLDVLTIFNAFPYETVMDYCVYMLPYYINVFFIFAINEMLFVCRKLFKQINNYLIYENSHIFNVNSLIFLARNHLILMTLVYEQNSVFGFAVLSLAANLFIWNVSFIYNSLGRFIHFKSLIELILAINMFSWVVINKLIYLFMCYGWVGLSNEVSYIFSSYYVGISTFFLQLYKSVLPLNFIMLKIQ